MDYLDACIIDEPYAPPSGGNDGGATELEIERMAELARSDRSSGKVVTGAVIGFAYGSILALLTFVAMGSGHGSWIPFLFSSAPLGVLTLLGETGVKAAVLGGAPIVWAMFGALVARPGSRELVRITSVLILLHYLSGLVLIAVTTGFGEFAYVLRMLRISPEILLAWVFFYLAGQVVLWRWVIGRGKDRPTGQFVFFSTNRGTDRDK